MDKDKSYRGLWFHERGGKGDKSLYYILFINLGFNWEKWFHELLRERPCGSWFSSKYINPFLGCLGVHSLFIVHTLHYVHSSFTLSLIHSFSWNGTMGVNCWGRSHCLLDVAVASVFQPWICACMPEMHWHVLNCIHNYESSKSQHGDSWPDALKPWKEVDTMRDCVAEKGVLFLGCAGWREESWCNLDCCVLRNLWDLECWLFWEVEWYPGTVLVDS